MRKTGFFVEISIVFAIGCSAGWLIELIFRRFWSGNNAEHRWVNPGYLRGPWLPVYGLGLLSLYLLSDLAAFLLFLFAAASDWFDGYIARKVGAVSNNFRGVGSSDCL